MVELPDRGRGVSARSGFVFDPETIHQLALEHLGLPPQAMFERIAAALAARYPGQIDPGHAWIFNNAGGAMIQVKFLHASLTEYVMFFGTPVGTEGHSGRHPAEFYDTVLDGEAWYYREGEFERTVYRPGDRIFVGRGEAAGMRIPDRVWMVEYARGAIPLLLPFGLADALTSTLDLATVGRTQRVYGSLLAKAFLARPRSALGPALGLAAAAAAILWRRSRA